MAPQTGIAIGKNCDRSGFIDAVLPRGKADLIAPARNQPDDPAQAEAHARAGEDKGLIQKNLQPMQRPVAEEPAPRFQRCAGWGGSVSSSSSPVK